MSQPKAKSRSAAGGDVVIKLNSGAKGTGTTIRFGSVEVHDTSFSQTQKRLNVGTGQAALSRAVTKILKAGFSKSDNDVAPRYRVDPHNPKVLIRELNGKSAKGTFVGGKFKALAK